MPSGGPSAASSLYSGIFAVGEQEADKAVPSVEGSTQDQEKIVAQEDGAAKSTSIESAAPSKPQGSANTGLQYHVIRFLSSAFDKVAWQWFWSAALRFAPRKNVNAQVNKIRRPPASALISSGFSVAPASGEEEQTAGQDSKSTQSSPTRNFDTEASSSKGWSKIASSEKASKQEVHIDALRATTSNNDARGSLPRIAGPPELSISAEELEKDKALFSTFAEKRGEKKTGAQQWNNDWQEDEEDEDINGFANTKEGRKAKRKKYKRKRNTSPGHHGGLSASLRMDAEYDIRVPNDYNEFKDLVRRRREAVKEVERKRKAEDVSRSGGGLLQEEDEYESDSEEDDSYRRSKMGRFAPPAIYNQAMPEVQRTATSAFDDDDDEKPYLSPPPRPPVQLPAEIPAPFTAPTMSGEEAYQRRLAMSQSFAPQTTAPEMVKSEVANSPPLPDLAARAAAAAAIAARLTKAAPPQQAVSKPSPPTFVSSTSQGSGSANFAERLMERQGWKKGEALGAEGNKGILDPILAEKVEAERRRKQAGTAHSNRGTLVNTREEEKRREEREKFGMASEVILLENMVDVSDIDDDLTGEIGDECSKHGFVQRVFIWPNGPDGVRIFVKFSGMAGAWRCVKELEGRFFGGKTVRARYYPIADFERGDYMKLYSKER